LRMLGPLSSQSNWMLMVSCIIRKALAIGADEQDVSHPKRYLTYYVNLAFGQ
jgi:hypothetical protein